MNFKKSTGMILIASMVMSSAAMPVLADDVAAVSVTVIASGQLGNAYAFVPQKLTVSANEAESFGYTDNVTDGVSALDVLVAETEAVYGSTYTAETKDSYLAVTESGWVTTYFGFAGDSGFVINDKHPTDGTKLEWGGYNGLDVNTAKVNDGDSVRFFSYQDAANMDNYATFTPDTAETVYTGQTLKVGIQGYCESFFGCYGEEIGFHTNPLSGVSVGILNTATGTVEQIEDAVTDENGVAEISFDKVGTYVIVPCGKDDTDVPVIMTTKTITVKTSKPVAELKKTTFTYNGKSHKPTVTVTAAGKTLKKDKDYTLTYTNTINAGTGKVTIRLKGKYSGTIRKTYTIKKAAQVITVNKTKYTFKKSALKSISTVFSIKASTSFKSKITYKSSDSNKVIAGSQGTVIVMKGISKGTYTVTLTTPATKNIKSGKAVVTIVIK